MGKNKKNRSGFIFSTNPDFDFSSSDDETQEESAPASQQKLRVMIDRKKRRGKDVTLVTGFEGNDDDLKDLGKFLKTKCGVGGSVKDGEILIQGNHKEKIVKLLIEKGYSQTKSSGGN